MWLHETASTVIHAERATYRFPWSEGTECSLIFKAPNNVIQQSDVDIYEYISIDLHDIYIVYIWPPRVAPEVQNGRPPGLNQALEVQFHAPEFEINIPWTLTSSSHWYIKIDALFHKYVSSYFADFPISHIFHFPYFHESLVFSWACSLVSWDELCSALVWA